MWLIASTLFFFGCGDNGTAGDGGGGNKDLSANTDGGGSNPDLHFTGDGGPNGCNPVDPMGDGQDCATANCPSGEVGVNQPGGGCKCFYKCNTATPQDCSCNRFCATLTDSDGGAAGGACLPANGPGERCGASGGVPFGTGVCAQGLTCAGAAAGAAYCLYNCGGQGDCPKQTQCTQISNAGGMVIGMACVYISASANAKANGAACNETSDHCMPGYICGLATCDQQCNSSTDTTSCTTGSCKVLRDIVKSQVIAYTCQP
jgi:hypothetical protein